MGKNIASKIRLFQDDVLKYLLWEVGVVNCLSYGLPFLLCLCHNTSFLLEDNLPEDI